MCFCHTIVVKSKTYRDESSKSLETLFPSLDQELLNILSPRNALKLYQEFTRSKSTHIYSTKKSTNEILDAINKDMRDFHTKLATQDLEFKMRLCAIEENKKGK